MKLVIICGSLESGRDGVGDYTRKLSVELVKLGHTVCLIAFNDAFVKGKTTIEESMLGVSLFRLPRSVAWKTRRELLMETIRAADPDWVSVQFVPFAFHPKGLCWRWLIIQKEIGRAYKLHVMFHEIWVEWNMPLKLSSRILGLMQKAIFVSSRMNRQISLAATHLDYYRKSLFSIGINAAILPLFSGIARTSLARTQSRGYLLRNTTPCDDAVYLAGFFGSIVSSFSLQLIERWILLRRKKGLRLHLFSAGKQDALTKSNWGQIVELARSYGVETHCLGPLTEEDVSSYILALDEGLSGYPKEFIAKSSSAAAMVDHGIIVTAVGSDGSGELEELFSAKPSDGTFSPVGKVARDLAEAFVKSSV